MTGGGAPREGSPHILLSYANEGSDKDDRAVA